MKLLSAVFTMGIANFAHAQKPINLQDIQHHIGDTVRVCGKIYGVYRTGTAGKPTLLSMGADYPNQFVTILIWNKERIATKGKLEAELVGKELCVTGKVELNRGKLQIAFDEAMNQY